LLFTDPLVLLVSKFESNYNTILAHSNSNVMENVGVIIIAIELTWCNWFNSGTNCS